MRKGKVYIVHPDRSVQTRPVKSKVAGYIDSKDDRWLLSEQAIFDARPLAKLSSWDELLEYAPAPPPPKRPAVLAIAGDVGLQPTLSDADLGVRLAKTKVAAIQDLLAQVGVKDNNQSALVWAMAGVMAICGLAILFMVIVAASAIFGGEDAGPAPPAPPPGVSVNAPNPWTSATSTRSSP